MKNLIIFSIFFLNSISLFAQADSLEINSVEKINKELSIDNFKEKNPTRAAVYSAVIPGLGQFYNKKYWKIPVVWGLLGIGTSFFLYSNNKRNEYREAFISELNNQPHKFTGLLDAAALGSAQDLYKRRVDYAVLLSVLAYFLNIVDANVDAHLSEFDREISLAPAVIQNNQNQRLGLLLKIKL